MTNPNSSAARTVKDVTRHDRETREAQSMAKLRLNLAGHMTGEAYFKDVDARLQAMGVSRGALARELGMNPTQCFKYFTDPQPNPTLKTVAAIEEAIVTLRRRKAQER